MQSDLDEVIFSVSSLDGQTVDADAANEDEKVKVADANISSVSGGDGKMGVISQTITWAGSASTGYTYTIDPASIVQGLIPQANIELFENVGAVFNATSGYFELNGLTDLCYDEMKTIYHYANLDNGAKMGQAFLQGSKNCRTNISTWVGTWNQRLQCAQLFFVTEFASILYTAKTGSNYVHANANYMFQQSNYLRSISILNFENTTSATSAFDACYSLEDCKIAKLKISVSFKDSSHLSLASVVYIVDNAANTSAITITLHATAYARCQADTTEYTYQGNTYTGIIALATAKNITIASA
jgi:hypothetical protein